MLLISGRSSLANKKPAEVPRVPAIAEIINSSMVRHKFIGVLLIPITFNILIVDFLWSYAIPILVYTINIPTKNDRAPNALILKAKLSEMNSNF